MANRFWLLIFLLELPVILGGFIAYREGYWDAAQVMRQLRSPIKFLTYKGHAGVIVLFFATCPLLAAIIVTCGKQWDAVTFIEVLLVASVASALIQQGWINDPVPSALVRNGLRMPGALNMVSMAIVFAVAAMYYVPAFTTQVDTSYTWIVSSILLVQLLAGILLPPLVVHGAIHVPAQVQAVAGTLIVIGLHVWRTW